MDEDCKFSGKRYNISPVSLGSFKVFDLQSDTDARNKIRDEKSRRAKSVEKCTERESTDEEEINSRVECKKTERKYLKEKLLDNGSAREIKEQQRTSYASMTAQNSKFVIDKNTVSHRCASAALSNDNDENEFPDPPAPISPEELKEMDNFFVGSPVNSDDPPPFHPEQNITQSIHSVSSTTITENMNTLSAVKEEDTIKTLEQKSSSCDEEEQFEDAIDGSIEEIGTAAHIDRTKYAIKETLRENHSFLREICSGNVIYLTDDMYSKRIFSDREMRHVNELHEKSHTNRATQYFLKVIKEKVNTKEAFDTMLLVFRDNEISEGAIPKLQESFQNLWNDNHCKPSQDDVFVSYPDLPIYEDNQVYSSKNSLKAITRAKGLTGSTSQMSITNSFTDIGASNTDTPLPETGKQDTMVLREKFATLPRGMTMARPQERHPSCPDTLPQGKFQRKLSGQAIIYPEYDSISNAEPSYVELQRQNRLLRNKLHDTSQANIEYIRENNKLRDSLAESNDNSRSKSTSNMLDDESNADSECEAFSTRRGSIAGACSGVMLSQTFDTYSTTDTSRSIFNQNHRKPIIVGTSKSTLLRQKMTQKTKEKRISKLHEQDSFLVEEATSTPVDKYKQYQLLMVSPASEWIHRFDQDFDGYLKGELGKYSFEVALLKMVSACYVEGRCGILHFGLKTMNSKSTGELVVQVNGIADNHSLSEYNKRASYILKDHVKKPYFEKTYRSITIHKIPISKKVPVLRFYAQSKAVTVLQICIIPETQIDIFVNIVRFDEHAGKERSQAKSEGRRFRKFMFGDVNSFSEICG